MTTHGYEEIDHTADLAMRIRGDDLYSLLVHAAEGLYSFMRIDINNKQHNKIEIKLRYESQESILVDFLNELLHFVEQKYFFTSFDFDKKQDLLTVQAFGHPIKKVGYSIKAATFHDLRFKETASGLEATVTFDV